jgi:hypothetical protein
MNDVERIDLEGGGTRRAPSTESNCEVTIKMHRGQVMRKMKAQSIVELLRMAEKIGLTPEASDPRRVTFSKIHKGRKP